MRETFNSELAHLAFVPFLHYIGDTSMEVSLKNHTLIRDLCFEHEQHNQLSKATLVPKFISDNTDDIPVCVGSTGSFGTNVALIGKSNEPTVNKSSIWAGQSISDRVIKLWGRKKIEINNINIFYPFFLSMTIFLIDDIVWTFSNACLHFLTCFIFVQRNFLDPIFFA